MMVWVALAVLLAGGLWLNSRIDAIYRALEGLARVADRRQRETEAALTALHRQINAPPRDPSDTVSD